MLCKVDNVTYLAMFVQFHKVKSPVLIIFGTVEVAKNCCTIGMNVKLKMFTHLEAILRSKPSQMTEFPLPRLAFEMQE